MPLHLQQRVYNEALFVIENVPNVAPVTWCHRLVVTCKHDGTPRRTVDLSPLNKFFSRETFPAKAHFQFANRVPGKTWKSVSDSWNSFHNVGPLRNSDRHLTTSITPFWEMAVHKRTSRFCFKEVDFAGFRISESNIGSVPNYIDAIRSLPTPKSIKDIGSGAL